MTPSSNSILVPVCSMSQLLDGLDTWKTVRPITLWKVNKYISGRQNTKTNRFRPVYEVENGGDLFKDTEKD